MDDAEIEQQIEQAIELKKFEQAWLLAVELQNIENRETWFECIAQAQEEAFEEMLWLASYECELEYVLEEI